MKHGILVGLFAVVLTFCIPAMANGASLDMLEQNYAASTDALGKTAALEMILNVGNQDAFERFYKLLDASAEKDVPCFEEAMSAEGTPQTLISFGPYMGYIMKSFDEQMKKADPNDDLIATVIKQTAQKRIRIALEKFRGMGLGISAAAKKDKALLVRAVRESFTEDGDMDNVKAMGAILGICSLGEDGAGSLLKIMDWDGPNRNAMIRLVRLCGPSIVIPVFKQYENPASTPAEKKTAFAAVHIFSNNPLVYDKVIEGVKHGRYFELNLPKDKDGKTVVGDEDLKKLSDLQLTVGLSVTYRDNRDFIRYVAEKHLPVAAGQDKVIDLLMTTNLAMAAPYLTKLDFSKLSDESVHVMRVRLAMSPALWDLMGAAEMRRSCVKEKCELLVALFTGLKKDVREKHRLIYGLLSMPASDVEKFVAENVAGMTDDEKKTVIMSCLAEPSPMGKVSVVTKKRVIDAIRKGASQEVLDTIEYMEKQKR